MADRPQVPPRPWSTDPEQPRVLRDGTGAMIGAMDTAVAAATVAAAVNTADDDTAAQVIALRERVQHYRHRMQMTPSERQGYLDEGHAESIQPEAHYITTREKPARDFLTAITLAASTARLLARMSRHTQQAEQQTDPEEQILTDLLAALDAATAEFKQAGGWWVRG